MFTLSLVVGILLSGRACVFRSPSTSCRQRALAVIQFWIFGNFHDFFLSLTCKLLRTCFSFLRVWKGFCLSISYWFSNFTALWSENIIYGILITRYLKLPWQLGHFLINVPFVFEKNVYSVFVGYRVLYMSIKSSIWCSNYPFPSLLFLLAVPSNQDSPTASMALPVNCIHSLFLSICLVCLFSLLD